MFLEHYSQSILVVECIFVLFFDLRMQLVTLFDPRSTLRLQAQRRTVHKPARLTEVRSEKSE